MNLSDFDDWISCWVDDTLHAFVSASKESLEGLGISNRQAEVLGRLLYCGEPNQTELAKMMGIEPSTLVRILDRMGRDGWIERCASPDDRRRKIIKPTQKALEAWPSILACGQKMEKQAIAGLSKKQLNDLKNTLTIIRKNLGCDK